MNARINFQTLLGTDGQPAFVVVPYAEFIRMNGGFTPGSIPHAVVSAQVDGDSATKAWREHLRLTQAELAQRMGISEATYAQIETAKRPHKVTLQKVADALGLEFKQLR